MYYTAIVLRTWDLEAEPTTLTESPDWDGLNAVGLLDPTAVSDPTYPYYGMGPAQLPQLQKLLALEQLGYRAKRQLFSQILGGAGRGKRQLFSQILGGAGRGKRQLFSQILGGSGGRGKRQLFSQILGKKRVGQVKRQLFSQILSNNPDVVRGKRQLFSQILSRSQERRGKRSVAAPSGGGRDKRSMTGEAQQKANRLFSQILRKKLVAATDKRNPGGLQVAY